MKVERIGPSHFAVELPEGRTTFCLDRNGFTVKQYGQTSDGRFLKHTIKKSFPEVVDLVQEQLTLL